MSRYLVCIVPGRMTARDTSQEVSFARRIAAAGLSAIIVTVVYFVFVSPPDVPPVDIGGSKMERRLGEQKRLQERIDAARRAATPAPVEEEPPRILLDELRRPSR